MKIFYKIQVCNMHIDKLIPNSQVYFIHLQYNLKSEMRQSPGAKTVLVSHIRYYLIYQV
jgi:hypothetical protein